MPEEGKSHCKNRQQRGERSKEHADFYGLAGGNNERWQLTEEIVEVTGALRGVILSTGHICNLFQSRFIDISAESTPAEAATEPASAEAKPAKRIAIPTIHGRGIIVCTKSNGIDSDAALHCLLSGIDRKRTRVAGTIGEQ